MPQPLVSLHMGPHHRGDKQEALLLQTAALINAFHVKFAHSLLHNTLDDLGIINILLLLTVSHLTSSHHDI